MLIDVPNIVVPFLERALRKLSRAVRQTAPDVSLWAEQTADMLRFEQTKED